VVPSPAQPTPADIIQKFKEKPINLEALFAGGHHERVMEQRYIMAADVAEIVEVARLLTELPFAPLHRHRSIVPNTWSQSVVLTP
jgi:hypothetical protein